MTYHYGENVFSCSDEDYFEVPMESGFLAMRFEAVISKVY